MSILAVSETDTEIELETEIEIEVDHTAVTSMRVLILETQITNGNSGSNNSMQNKSTDEF